MYMDITGIAVKLDSRSALSPLASCYPLPNALSLVHDSFHFFLSNMVDSTYRLSGAPQLK